MKHNKKLLSVLAIGLMMSGCASRDVTQLNVASPLSIISEASQEALIAQQNLKNSSAIQMQTVQKKQGSINHDLLNIDYIGDPIPLIKSISSQYGYRFVEAGPTHIQQVAEHVDVEAWVVHIVFDALFDGCNEFKAVFVQ